jgi:predicted Zn-dependent protease
MLSGHAIYFDGSSSRKRRVALRFASALEIVEDGIPIATWPFNDIRRADGAQEMLRLSCVSAPPLARLEIADAQIKQDIALHCASLDAGRSGSRQTVRIVAWSLAAVCSILILILYGIPFAADRMTPLIPLAVENRIGEAVDRQVRFIFGGKTCNDPEGQAALSVMIEKIRQAGEVRVPLQAEVLSHALPNALALPGGKVYLLDGLLQKARNADEIAGVIAHELAHVQHRDGLRRVIQTGGTSFLGGLLLGDITGSGAVIFVARSIVDASYSREVEQSADTFAIGVMHKLGRSPRPMGELLLRITGEEAKKGATILSSHPLSEERLARMKKEDRPNTGEEILTADQWRALKAICPTPL